MYATKAPCKACGGAFSAHSSPRRECPTGGTFLTQTTRDGSYARCTNCKTYQDSHETAEDGRKLCPDGSGRELKKTKTINCESCGLRVLRSRTEDGVCASCHENKCGTCGEERWLHMLTASRACPVGCGVLTNTVPWDD